MREKTVLTSTAKAILAKRVTSGSGFYLPSTPFSVFEDMVDLSGSAVVVYVAITIAIAINGQGTGLPKSLRDRINITRTSFSRAVKQLETAGLLKVERVPGHKLRFRTEVRES